MRAHSTRKHAGLTKRLVVAALASAAVLVLAGCGADIDTTMHVAKNGSGSRVMTLTLSGDDAGKLSGGVAAADASIRDHLPSQLSYSGIKKKSDGDIVTSFTLRFSDPAQYREKASALLGLNDGSVTAPEFDVTDSVLRTGISIDEQFSSQALLGWMFDGLVSDGVIDSGDSSNASSIGTTKLEYNGRSISQGSTYEYSALQDNGFTSVAMRTDIVDADHVTRVVDYKVDTSQYAAHADVYKRFFASATPQGATLATPADGQWTLTFIGTAAEIAADTDLALSAKGTVFAVASGSLKGDPASRLLSVKDQANCGNVCATDSGDAVPDTITAGSHFAPSSKVVENYQNDGVRFTDTPAFRSVRTDVTFGLFGSVKSTTDFTVATADVKRIGTGFATLLRPAKGVGTLTSSRSGANTVYSVSIEGADTAAFAKNMRRWDADNRVIMTEFAGSSPLHRDATISVTPSIASVTGSHKLRAVTTVVHLPFGQQVDSSAGSTGKVASSILGTTVTATGADRSIAFRAGGPTVVGMGIIAGVVLVLAGIVVLLIRFRRRIGSWLEKVGARAGTKLDDVTPRGVDALRGAAERTRNATRREAPVPGFGLVGASAATPASGSLLDDQPHQSQPAKAGSLFDLA